ncbi:hypothetical protein HY256_07830 [Candidatus Sumerlaeota bacterium]|nr:hypothetical protein [Candidatus Sumerlaeota bacterium]
MNEILTMDEIKKRFHNEWVLIEDPEVNIDLEVFGGKVLSHHADVKFVDEDALKFKPIHAAILYIGELPENVIFAL